MEMILCITLKCLSGHFSQVFSLWGHMQCVRACGKNNQQSSDYNSFIRPGHSTTQSVGMALGTP